MEITYLLAASYARGGIKICIEHCNRLAGAGHSVSILGREPEPSWIDVQVPWQVAEGRLGERLERCDAVVFSFYEQAYWVMRPALEAGAVPVFFAQGDEIIFGGPEHAAEERDHKAMLAARASLRYPYPILTVSEAAAERIRDLGGPRCQRGSQRHRQDGLQTGTPRQFGAARAACRFARAGVQGHRPGVGRAGRAAQGRRRLRGGMGRSGQGWRSGPAFPGRAAPQPEPARARLLICRCGYLCRGQQQRVVLPDAARGHVVRHCRGLFRPAGGA